MQFILEKSYYNTEVLKIEKENYYTVREKWAVHRKREANDLNIGKISQLHSPKIKSKLKLQWDPICIRLTNVPIWQHSDQACEETGALIFC